jgi:DNA-binding response OmpR family regulator
MRCSYASVLETRDMTVAVVDPRLPDYGALPEAVGRPDMKWHFVTSGRGALRLALSQQVDLWVINTALSDMSGIDLCAMLKGRSPPPVVYMVTDDYRVEDERAARCCGVSLFACKPIQATWFGVRIADPEPTL